ncbi:sialate O-acetylesterase [Pedobacter sp. Leaf216]|uniref:GDSL-type esterase/lipase family protein n=1 Tax=Pedobacter sp. Leaf216 TaxID=1735684 RepID=UPI0006F7C653|nr:GDSL-type esterase/lipase family protein [Pedobacter sp. Leaf216]KQM69279.1 sialate O-acetylesterase [Pedobacter sp. Leaf216]
MKAFLGIVSMLFFLISTNGYAQKIKVACIGNSVTAGYLLANPKQESYPAQLQQLLGNNYLVGNFGHSGATLLKKGHNPYYKTKEFDEALKFRADVAIVHLGLNDTDPRNWPNYKDEFQADYQWLIEQLKQGNPKLKIYICKLSPIFSGHPRFKSGTRDWYWQVQKKIEQIAGINQFELLDLNAALSNRPDLFADDLHPDITGAGIIAKTVYSHIIGDFGGFKLDAIFSDHMVLQRDQPIPVYGTGNAGEKVTVELNHIIKHVITNKNGSWKVFFPPTKFGGPYTMRVISKQHDIFINDVMIGDLWLCSGQSNMAFPLKSSATAQATLSHLNKNPSIRLLKYNLLAETDNISWDEKTLGQINALHYFSGSWAKADVDQVGNFSAVAYYFGEKLSAVSQVPIGLIQMAVGGSTMESWIDRKTLEHDDLLVDLLANWRKSDFMQDWVRSRADLNLKNAINTKQRHPYEPAYNYEAGISNLVGFPIKGVIWYQGESNAHNVELFTHEFPLLVKSWRKKWQRNFPFYYVQLSAIDRPSWPYFRDAQRKLQAVIPNSGMAVSSDLGDSVNVHPAHKKEIGERLALLALKNTYHHNVLSSGPVAIKAVKMRNTIVITFNQAKKLMTANDEILKGFEVEDDHGNHLKVKSAFFNNKVHLTVPKELKVIRVLYAWQPFTRANLINEAKLPASTFSIPIN